MKRFGTILLLLALPAPLFAGSYFQQSSFAVSPSSVSGIDADSVGNLYLLGRSAGSATLGVSGYGTPALGALFSFDTGLSLPAAFAVEGTGIIDVLDASSGTSFALKRFTNPGTLVGQASYTIGISTTMYAAAFDKANGRLYIAYQYTYHPIYLMCLGCGGPSTVTRTNINEYDLAGNQITSFGMPGTDATAGSCYTPTAATVDSQGNLYIADANCQQLLKFSPSGTLLSSTPASKWTYSFSPRGMWTDKAGNVYISEASVIQKLDSSANPLTSLTADSSVGCAWDARILYLPASGGQPVRRFVYDAAPSVPAESAPLGLSVQHSSAAALSWQAASDADGDAVSYSIYVGTDPNAPGLIGTSAQPSFTSQPLTFGVTYYWQVVAQDSYLSQPLQKTQAPVVSFNLALLNRAPSAFAVVSGTDTVATRATSVQLGWQPAVDPDGDPVTYAVSWSTGGATQSATTAGTAWTLSGIGFGTTYYWSVTAYDVYGASASLPTQSYLPTFANSAPSAPVVVSPTGVIPYHGLSPALTIAWQPALDPDGDPVQYRVLFGTAAAALTAQPASASSSAVAGLALGTSYYYRVDAFDPYGATSVSPLNVVSYQLVDNPPSPVGYGTQASEVSIHCSSPTFAFTWQASSDPDGDAVAYALDIASGGVAARYPAAAAIALTEPLALETTYQWRVVAYDQYGGASTGTWLPLIIHLANQPPSAPVATTPVAVSTRGTSFPITWDAASDPDGDPVSYLLAVGVSSAALSPVQASTATTYSLPLQYGTTAYYRVTAIDSFGARIDGPVQTLYAAFLNDPPAAPNIVSPFSREPVVKTMRNSVTVSWDQVSDPQGDPITYTVFFGDAAGGMSPVATVAQVQQAGRSSLSLAPLRVVPQAQAQVQSDSNTVVLNLTGLDFYKSYYLRVAASNPYGATATTGVQSFTLAAADGFPKAYNYPNPFSPLRGGTNIVFSAPSSGYAKATVEVYSELQDLLFKQDYFNIPAGISQVHFDGRDRYGRPFYNGSYIARVVFSGPDDKQVFYLLVVK